MHAVYVLYGACMYVCAIICYLSVQNTKKLLLVSYRQVILVSMVLLLGCNDGFALILLCYYHSLY